MNVGLFRVLPALARCLQLRSRKEVIMKTLALGELISAFYDEYLALYGGDEDLASVAAAASVNKLIGDFHEFEDDYAVEEEAAA